MPWEIIAISEGVKLDRSGNFERTRIVQFRVGEHGPFQIEIPGSEFTEGRVRELLEAQAREISGLLRGGL